MTISDILGADRVVSGVTFTSKKKALEELSNLLALGQPSLSANDVLGSLTAREKLGSTGLGRGVAIPHGRLAGVDKSIGAVMRLKHPLDYDAHDSTRVDLMFGLIVPQTATEEHLKHLAAIAEMFSDEAFCARLRSTDDSAELHTMVAQYKPAQ
jgi:nitrogen PTS system EIIA component